MNTDKIKKVHDSNLLWLYLQIKMVNRKEIDGY